MIINIYSASEKDKEIFGQLAEDHQVNFFESTIDSDTTNNEEVEVVSVFVNSKITKETLDHFPNLKLITTRSTGFDHIDTEETNKRGIVVTNVPAYGSRTVAEFVFTLILMLSRKASEAYEALRREGQTDKNIYEGFNLTGKTLGVVGTGNIGKHTAEIGRGFSMDILAFDINPDSHWAETNSIKYVDLNTLLSSSDIISLHLPLNPQTSHIINSQNINTLKPGSILINTARGGLIETEAILKGLEKNILAGAGLDVLEGEDQLQEEVKLLLSPETTISDFKTLLANHELLDKKEVIVTPHIAFNTKEAKEEIRQITLDNIEKFIKGQTQNKVK